MKVTTKKQILTDDDMAAVIKRLVTGDTEVDHGAMDRALCELLRDLGYTKTVEAYESIPKWYA